VFAEATRDGDQAARGLHDRILSVNSITKCLGFGPMHVGWIAGPRKLIDRIHDAKDHVRPQNPILSIQLARRILPHRRKILDATRRRRAANAGALGVFFAQEQRLQGQVPDHGTTMVAKLPTKHRDDVAFARRLLKKEGVLVSPGRFVEMPGWIRIGLLCDPKALHAGLEALDRALG
jgi:aspartate/methionine/tyrosine aminotransferase